MKKVRLAVISDLHCHPEYINYSDNNTLLYSDKLRSPTNEHPVENLLELISDTGIEAEIVLCPGDFTHRCNRQGFLSGWSYTKEISKALKCKHKVVATIGNHDIDSRHEHSQYSFDIPKKIRQDFPISSKHIGNFWDEGFTFIEEDTFRILVINSTHYHTHIDQTTTDNPVVKGKIDRSQIEMIDNYLSLKNDDKIKIALCHHHPVKHSRYQLGEHDFVENGEDLLTVLGQHKFDIFIHGHKHDPWLRYHLCENGHSIPLLSSGSFSATNQISWINKFNYFHLIEIEKDSSDQACGKIDTWTFKNRLGWKNDKEEGFYPKTGFGYFGSLQELLNRIATLFQVKDFWQWSEILLRVPEISYLTPDKMESLQEQLLQKKIYLNNKIGLNPKHAYYERA